MEKLPRALPHEQPSLSSGLDYYKLTMSQLEREKFPDVDVTFTFKNRSNQRLAEFVDPAVLQTRLDTLRERGWNADELESFRAFRNTDGEQVFSDDYLGYLASNKLPEVRVRIDEITDDLAIDTTGEAGLTTFWETLVMSEVNQLYFEEMVEAKGLDINELYAEGDHRLDEKIAYFQANPDVKFADFGTRRRFSLEWQEHVIERLATECPDNFIGTSNIHLSAKLGRKPIGTFAHELPMIYAGVADARDEDIRASHGHMLDDWYGKYGKDLGIALSDTFGTDFFFESFTREQAKKYVGTRQDSGDPIAYGKKAIQFYERNGLDPADQKTIFSDGLNIQKVDRIKRCFSGILGNSYGIGTDLTNDLGLVAGNNVMKATRVHLKNGKNAGLVKLSDDEGKRTGSEADVRRYAEEIFKALASKEEALLCLNH